jgi:phage terminase small subunit
MAKKSSIPNDRQRLFVEFYLGAAKLNATKAARLAGYSCPAVAGCRLRKEPEVAARIKERVEGACMTANEALYLLSEHARGTLAPFLYDEFEDGDADLAPRGTIKTDTDAAKENVHLLKEVTQVVVDFEGGRRTTNKIKLHDPQTALRDILRAHGVFKDDGSDLLKLIDVSRLTTRQLQRIKAGEDILAILINPDGQDADDAHDLGEVEDLLPPARGTTDDEGED